MRDDGKVLSAEQLAHLARYFEEEVMSATNYKIPHTAGAFGSATAVAIADANAVNVANAAAIDIHTVNVSWNNW